MPPQGLVAVLSQLKALGQQTNLRPAGGLPPHRRRRAVTSAAAVMISARRSKPPVPLGSSCVIASPSRVNTVQPSRHVSDHSVTRENGPVNRPGLPFMQDFCRSCKTHCFL